MVNRTRENPNFDVPSNILNSTTSLEHDVDPKNDSSSQICYRMKSNVFSGTEITKVFPKDSLYNVDIFPKVAINDMLSLYNNSVKSINYKKKEKGEEALNYLKELDVYIPIKSKYKESI